LHNRERASLPPNIEGLRVPLKLFSMADPVCPAQQFFFVIAMCRGFELRLCAKPA